VITTNTTGDIQEIQTTGGVNIRVDQTDPAAVAQDWNPVTS
jgi:hypothetical protein